MNKIDVNSEELEELINIAPHNDHWIDDIHTAEEVMRFCWEYAAHTTDNAFTNSKIAFGTFLRISFIMGQRAERARRKHQNQPNGGAAYE